MKTRLHYNRDLTRSIILSVSINILENISYYETILMLENPDYKQIIHQY